MRKLLLIAALAGAPLVACSKSETAAKHEENLPEISVDEVAAAIESKSATVFDCNSDRTRKKVGILPGAVLVADEEAYPASILPADKTAKLIFYCGGPG